MAQERSLFWTLGRFSGPIGGITSGLPIMRAQPASYFAQTEPFVLLLTRSLGFVVKKSAGAPFAVDQDEVP